MAGVPGKSGRKPLTSDTIKGKDRLRKNDPLAVRVIEYQLKSANALIEEYENRYNETGNVNDLPPLPSFIEETAWKVYEQNHGKAKQAIDLKESVEHTISPSILAEAYKRAQIADKGLIEGEYQLIGMDNDQTNDDK